jgi:hypothetical protein
MRVGEICVTARLRPTDVAGCKLRLADLCTLTEALDYAAISRAGAGRTCRASERTISAGPAIRGSDLARAVLLPFAGTGVLVSVVEVSRLVMGDVNSWLQVGVVAAALGLAYAGLLLPAWRRGVAA